MLDSIAILYSLLLLWFMINHDKRMIVLIAASLSFWGLSVANIDISRISAIMALGYVVINYRYFLITKKILYIVTFYLASLLILSFLSKINGLPNVEGVDFGLAQHPDYRNWIQWIQRISFVSLFVLMFHKKFQQEIILLFLKGYILGITVQSLLAGYQLLAFKYSLPIWDYFGGSVIIFDFLRINGLAGEPRHLAAFILPSLFVLFFAYRKTSIIFSRKKILYMIILQMTVLVMTFSSSGIVLFIVAGATILISAILKPKNFLSIKKLTLIISSIFIAIAAINTDYFNKRIFERVNFVNFVNSEFSTFAAIEVFQNKPEHVLIGLGVGTPAYYLRSTNSFQEGLWRNTNSTSEQLRDPNGLVLLLLESGLLGVVLLLFVIIFVNKRNSKKEREIFLPIKIFANMSILLSLVTYGVLSPMFMMSFGGVVLYFLRKEKVNFITR